MESSSNHIAAGQAALTAADWLAARAHFEAALKEQDSPEAHDGLGLALWWLNEIERAHRQRAIAYVGFKKAGQLSRAALIAAWLSREQVFLYANFSAMKGWFARADRLLSQAGPCPERGWLTILRASMLATPEELERMRLQAIEVARQFHHSDLEAFALAFTGMARASLAPVHEGMAHLDEAMAAATGGEVGSLMTVSEI